VEKVKFYKQFSLPSSTLGNLGGWLFVVRCCPFVLKILSSGPDWIE